MNYRGLKYEMSMDFCPRYLKPTAVRSSNKMLASFIYVSEITVKADANNKKQCAFLRKKKKKHLFI